MFQAEYLVAERIGQNYGKSGDVIKELLFQDETLEEVISYLAERVVDDLDPDFDDHHELEMMAGWVTQDWLSDRYLQLQTLDSYPDDYSFIVHISQGEALEIVDNEEMYTDYKMEIAEYYSYSSAQFRLSFEMLRYAEGKVNDMHIEAHLLWCVLQQLAAEGWFIVCESGLVFNIPFRPIF